MKTKFLLSSVLALMALLFAGQVSQAQGLKIGFVKDDVIKQDYKAWSKAQEQWDLETKAWEDEALAKQQELDDLQQEYDRQKLILSEDKRREKEAAISAKKDALDAYTRQIFGPSGTAERKHDQLIRPLLENVSKAIEAVAIEENYDVIFTLQSGLGYIKEDYDCTDKVLKYLEENEG
jgi:outer membrane protein